MTHRTKAEIILHLFCRAYKQSRKMTGYGSFDTYEQLDIIKRMERLLAFCQNYFQPLQKLVLKTRTGAMSKRNMLNANSLTIQPV